MSRVICVDAVGARIGIDLGDAAEDLAEAVERAWADAVAHGDGDPETTIRPSGTAIERALESLSQQVTMAALQSGRGGSAWMLHAAGLASATGDVVVLVGPSGRGKTTASRALGRQFGYVSDETIAIEETGRVRPYRKPLSVIETRGQPKVQVAPSEAGLAPLPAAPLRVRAIVLLDRDPAHRGEPDLEAVDLGDALAELVAQSSFLVHATSPLRFMAAVARSTGGVHRLRYAEASELVPVIARLFASAPPPNPQMVIPPAMETPVVEGQGPDPDPDSPRFTRAPWADAVDLADPDRIAILTVDEAGRGTASVITGIAPAIWRAANASTVDELTQAALAAHGQPEGMDPREVVQASVEALIDAGLIVSDAG